MLPGNTENTLVEVIIDYCVGYREEQLKKDIL